MKITISSTASSWYVDELELAKGDSIRFYVRYGGHSPIQSGYSLGIAVESPEDPGVLTEVDGITYFVEKSDLWYFDGRDLAVEYSEKRGEPEFLYQ